MWQQTSTKSLYQLSKKAQLFISYIKHEAMHKNKTMRSPILNINNEKIYINNEGSC